MKGKLIVSHHPPPNWYRDLTEEQRKERLERDDFCDIGVNQPSDPLREWNSHPDQGDGYYWFCDLGKPRFGFQANFNRPQVVRVGNADAVDPDRGGIRTGYVIFFEPHFDDSDLMIQDFITGTSCWKKIEDVESPHAVSSKIA